MLRLPESISTHAPLAGRDRLSDCGTSCHPDFNPRAPCGARPGLSDWWFRFCVFQPTRPLRGATRSRDVYMRSKTISTHAPLAGRDCIGLRAASNGANFNPRAPCGARQQMCTKITCIFATTDKNENIFPVKRRLSERLMRKYWKTHKRTRCEPPWKSLHTSPPHYTIRVSSGR